MHSLLLTNNIIFLPHASSFFPQILLVLLVMETPFTVVDKKWAFRVKEYATVCTVILVIKDIKNMHRYGLTEYKTMHGDGIINEGIEKETKRVVI